MRDILVSVIIPVWNHAVELQKCLVSLERQTYSSYELIIVDDGSTDGVIEKLKNWQWKTPYRIFQNEFNQGAPAARNKGFQASKGEFIIFLDADVILAPHALETMVRTLESNQSLAFVYPSFRFGWKTFIGRPFDAKALHEINYIHTSALMRRGFFPGFDESLKKFQDWDLWLTIIEKGGEGRWINEVLYSISPHSNGYSSWLPRFIYRLPLAHLFFSNVRRYVEAKKIILTKHKL